MKIVWDRLKAEANRGKHGVSFFVASTVFGDPLAITFNDPDHSVSEERFVTFGVSAIGRMLVVVHMDRGDTTRIISARRPTRAEVRIYEEE